MSVADVSSDVQASITSGNMEIKRKSEGGKSIIRYTILHLKVAIFCSRLNVVLMFIETVFFYQAQISATKIWESSSYLLWTLYPEYDIESEYGCLAKHESLREAKSAQQTLSELCVNVSYAFDDSNVFDMSL